MLFFFLLLLLLLFSLPFSKLVGKGDRIYLRNLLPLPSLEGNRIPGIRRDPGRTSRRSLRYPTYMERYG